MVVKDGGPSLALAPRGSGDVSPDLIKPKEVATRLGMSLGHVYELIDRRVIPGVKIEKSVRIPRAAFEEWLAGLIDTAVAAVGPTGVRLVPSATRQA